MKNSIFSLIILFLFCLIFACSKTNLITDNNLINTNDKGNLSIMVNYEKKEGVTAKNNTLVSSGKIVLTRDDLGLKQETELIIANNMAQTQIQGLIIGTWHIAITLQDKNDVTLYYGETTANILKDQTATASITLTDNVGALSFNITFNDPNINTSKIQLVRQGEQAITKNIDLPIENKQGKVLVNNLLAGTWEYNIYVYDKNNKLISCETRNIEVNAQETKEITASNDNSINMIITLPDDNPAWQKCYNMSIAKSNLAIGVVHNKIYAIGGFRYFEYFNTVEEYDPATNIWQQKASMPTARYSLAVCVVNNKIYAIGGVVYSSGFFSTVEEYDPVTDTWQQKTNMPTARSDFAVGVVNNKIYAIGGYKYNYYSSGYLNTVEEYDPATDTWQRKTDMPTAKSNLAIGVVNNKIYAIGGYTGSSLSTVEEYDPVTDTWQQKTDMPTARSSFAIGVVNNKIYAIGGYDGKYLNTVEEYDPVTDTWQQKTDMPTARSSFAIGVVNNKIYAIGGYNYGYLITDEEYDPAKDY